VAAGAEQRCQRSRTTLVFLLGEKGCRSEFYRRWRTGRPVLAEVRAGGAGTERQQHGCAGRTPHGPMNQNQPGSEPGSIRTWKRY